MRLRKVIVAALLAAAALFAAAGCQSEPVTGRRQFIILSPSEEAAMGAQAFQEVLAQSKLSADAATNAILQRVGLRIAAQAQRPEYQWEFKLLESEEVNAFCLPGGKVAVYTGILPYCRNEAGLAAVVAHEVAHALARHGAERMSQGLVLEIIASGIQRGTGKLSPSAQAGILQAYGIAATVGAELPFSRTQESAADRIGIELAARAGYVPTEAVALWERMAAGDENRPPAFLSTHPAPESRIEALSAVMPAMMELYKAAPEQLGEGAALLTVQK